MLDRYKEHPVGDEEAKKTSYQVWHSHCYMPWEMFSSLSDLLVADGVCLSPFAAKENIRAFKVDCLLQRTSLETAPER